MRKLLFVLPIFLVSQAWCEFGTSLTPGMDEITITGSTQTKDGGLTIGGGIGVSTTPSPGSISVPTVTYTNTTDGIVRNQSNPGLELLVSSVPNAAISTMSVTFSTRPYIYIVFYGSPTAQPGGDVFVRFNGSDSPIYSIESQSGNRTSVVNRSSQTAVGLPVFGPELSVNKSTSTLRLVRIYVFGNEVSQPKLGHIDGVAITTSTQKPQFVEADWQWDNTNQQINRVDVTFAQTEKPYAEGAQWRIGSRLHVYGRND